MKKFLASALILTFALVQVALADTSTAAPVAKVGASASEPALVKKAKKKKKARHHAGKKHGKKHAGEPAQEAPAAAPAEGATGNGT